MASSNQTDAFRQRGPSSPTNDGLDDTLDLDSNDGFDDGDSDSHYHGGHQGAAFYYEDDLQPIHYPPASRGSQIRAGTCVVCRVKPSYNRGGKSYPTCGLTCAGRLDNALNNTPQRGGYITGRGGRPVSYTGAYHSTSIPTPFAPPLYQNHGPSGQHVGGGAPNAYHPLPSRGGYYSSARGGQPGRYSQQAHPAPVRRDPCVICRQKPCHGDRYVTCGLKCAEKLCKGEADTKLCDYCHRRPKASGYNQCGIACRDLAKFACLLCMSRPKHKSYHLCGKTCKQISTKTTPLVLKVPEGHVTYDMVMKKFDSAWKGSGTKPKVKNIFKIIESSTFLQPYDRYKKTVGNEVFRYHGTARACTLGSGTTTVCSTTGCKLCGILKTSFKTSLANPGGCFGPGIYSSSAANKAYGYCSGVMLLTKVVIGKPYNGAAKSCPTGYNSIEYDTNGPANETIVYSDDAIRPVFLLTFT